MDHCYPCRSSFARDWDISPISIRPESYDKRWLPWTVLCSHISRINSSSKIFLTTDIFSVLWIRFNSTFHKRIIHARRWYNHWKYMTFQKVSRWHTSTEEKDRIRPDLISWHGRNILHCKLSVLWLKWRRLVHPNQLCLKISKKENANVSFP